LTLRKLAIPFGLILVALSVVNCGDSSERTITPQEEKEWRNPPKDKPPAGYSGNGWAAPKGPPAAAGTTGG